MSDKALIIDEDHGLLALLRFGLEQDGFTVVTVDDGREALRSAYDSHPDIIIMDIAMEESDGWAICRQLRFISDVPIIVLTASADERQVIKALSLGADEYLTKPRGLEELKARVRAVLRRARMGRARAWQPIYEDANLRVDLVNGTATRGGDVVHLTPTESRLLMCLVSRRGEVVPHRELLVKAWGQEYAEAVDYLSVYIRYLREKLEEDPSNPHYIRTRWGIGYFFAGDGVVGGSDNHV
jgi:two-component system KDP operon response regulator KdpE